MADAEHDLELTEAEKAVFESKKTRLFKATIAVNVVYGFIALCVLIAIFTNEAARSFLTGSFAPFTITFMIGMLLIIIWLVIEVYEFKAVKGPSVHRDSLACPDYYVLERTPEETLNRAPAELKGYMEYRCVPREDLFPKNQFTTLPAFTDYAVKDVVTEFNSKLPADPSKTSPAGPFDADMLKCNNIYPAYLHTKDSTQNKDENNKYRCEFIGKNGCNTLSWTTVCPHPKN